MANHHGPVLYRSLMLCAAQWQLLPPSSGSLLPAKPVIVYPLWRPNRARVHIPLNFSCFISNITSLDGGFLGARLEYQRVAGVFHDMKHNEHTERDIESTCKHPTGNQGSIQSSKSQCLVIAQSNFHSTWGISHARHWHLLGWTTELVNLLVPPWNYRYINVYKCI